MTTEDMLRNDENPYEEPEGLEASSFDLGDYPIDSVLIRNEPRTVFEIRRRMDQGHYILNPDFQRDFVWKEDKQSKLIESTLMRIPLPVFYLAETLDGRVIVVDGLQRLTTFQRYISNKFPLRDLTGKSEELNNKYFQDLPPKLQNRIEDTPLILYLIDSKVPDRARLDIFERVNSGVPLSRQQMRNCLYMGNATRWLKEQADNPIFREATGNSLNRDTMRDREAINRFCGFYIFGISKYEELRGDMDEFLAKTLQEMNKANNNYINKNLAPAFKRSMINNQIIFGKHAFRKHNDPKISRNVINIALFDIYSVLMTKFSNEYVLEHKKDFYKIFYDIQDIPSFKDAITSSTNSVKNVRNRFSIIENYHEDLLLDAGVTL